MDQLAVVLSHTYGTSYFGSGGAYGSVRVYNADCIGGKDNGFVAGPESVRVINPTKPRLQEPHACILLMIVREADQHCHEEAAGEH